MQLKRVSDNWVFSGDWGEYAPMKPRTKVNEIEVIRGASRFQNLGHKGSLGKFKLRFYDAVQANDFMSKFDSEYEFTDELGKVYKGIFKDEPDLTTIGSGTRRIYELSCVFYSQNIAGVGC